MGFEYEDALRIIVLFPFEGERAFAGYIPLPHRGRGIRVSK
jgi:hypothetical protein